MTHAERYAWFSLAAWLAIVFFLLMRFTTGTEILGQSLGLTIVEQPAAKLLGTYVTLAIIAIIAESVIATVMAVTSGKTTVEADERDHAIEARANLAAYWFMAAAVNVIVLQVLASAAYGSHVLPELTTLTGMSFVLLLTLALAEVVKRIALIWNYRAA